MKGCLGLVLFYLVFFFWKVVSYVIGPRKQKSLLVETCHFQNYLNNSFAHFCFGAFVTFIWSQFFRKQSFFPNMYGMFKVSLLLTENRERIELEDCEYLN